MFMKKEEVRKEFFKLKNGGFSYAKCRSILSSLFDYQVSIRTLKRWMHRLDYADWDLRDISRRPRRIYYKITPEIIARVCSIRKRTGYGQDKIKQSYPELNVSSMSIKRILKENGLARQVKHSNRRIKWVRWQRKHPNSLWQIDHTDEQDKFNCYTLSVLDDCSRYSIAIVKLNHVTTSVVTAILDELIKQYGKPREILTDNGSAYGGNSKHSKFDRWCRKRKINHIRSRIHSPQTCGKVERLFKTMDEELGFSKNNMELFRLRYNHFRPHSSLSGKKPADVYFD